MKSEFIDDSQGPSLQNVQNVHFKISQLLKWFTKLTKIDSMLLPANFAREA